MTYKELDFLFPFFVLAYGALMTFVLNSPQLMKMADRKFPADLVQQMNLHRYLAIVCLVVGSLWSLQNLWTGDVEMFTAQNVTPKSAPSFQSNLNQ